MMDYFKPGGLHQSGIDYRAGWFKNPDSFGLNLPNCLTENSQLPIMSEMQPNQRHADPSLLVHIENNHHQGNLRVRLPKYQDERPVLTRQTVQKSPQVQPMQASMEDGLRLYRTPSAANHIILILALLDALESELAIEKPNVHDRIPKQEKLKTFKVKPFGLDQIETMDAEHRYNLLMKIATKHKDSSLDLQDYLSASPDNAVLLVRESLLPQAELLITHKYGSYVLQRLVTRDTYSLAYLSDFCLARFERLKKNEYASRLLQTLIEVSHSFRVTALELIKLRLDEAFELGSVNHLLKAIIKSCPREAELDFLIDLLHLCPGVLQKKLFRISIQAVIQKCSTNRLERIARCLNVEQNWWKFLGSKSLTAMVSSLLCRGESSTEVFLIKALKQFPLRLFAAKCSKHLFIWLIAGKGACDGLLAHIGSVLLSTSDTKILEFRHLGLFNLYLFVTIKMTQEEDLTALNNFLNRRAVIGGAKKVFE